MYYKKINLFILLLFFFASLFVNAEELEINISQGNIKPTPIAITDFFSKDLKSAKVGKDISAVIANNLERSGLFIPLDKKAFIQDNESLNKKPRFEDWKLIKVEHLVSGKIDIEKDLITVEFRLFDVLRQKDQLIRKRYETVLNNWRQVAHIISDEIFERISSLGGYFDTKIVYIAESGPVGKKRKSLAIMDQDQSNHIFLTDGTYLVMTPRFSPSS